jgi:hypothetical protein
VGKAPTAFLNLYIRDLYYLQTRLQKCKKKENYVCWQDHYVYGDNDPGSMGDLDGKRQQDFHIHLSEW